MDLITYFTDAVLRGPTIGSMLMCLATAWVGVILFLRKQSLMGETLSHAAYPGVIFGVLCTTSLSIYEGDDLSFAVVVMVGAFVSGLMGLYAIHWLERSLKIRNDAALCFVLSVFFGVGLTLASHIQLSHTALYRQVQAYLYGQAATMTDFHIVVYGFLSITVISIILLFYKELQSIAFNRDFAVSLGISVKAIESLFFVLIVAAIVISMRSVGIILMAAMLIAPAVAARQYTDRLSRMFGLAGLFGILSGYVGNYLSVELTHILSKMYPGERLMIPTGPMIVLVASALCFFSLLFAPKRGLLLRLLRIGYFRYRCLCENVLKTLWRHENKGAATFSDIAKRHHVSSLYLRFILKRLIWQGWVESLSKNTYQLTPDGRQWAARVVRLHRLWEVYLADHLGVGAERVHCNAEEMEHILTPELEKELTLILHDPQHDPHHQQIPKRNFRYAE